MAVASPSVVVGGDVSTTAVAGLGVENGGDVGEDGRGPVVVAGGDGLTAGAAVVDVTVAKEVERSQEI